jgi:hypothetical protein
VTILVRPLVESDLDEARVGRLAFGTFVGLKDPLAMWGDADYARSRWRSDPEGALAAEHNGQLAGSNFAVRWGSLASARAIRCKEACQSGKAVPTSMMIR